MKKIKIRRKDGVVQSYWKGDIEKLTEKNKFFRKVLFTGKNEQLVVMSIPVMGEIGDEVHPNIDQFFRIEEGRAKITINGKSFISSAPGGSFVVPRGMRHNVRNIGKIPLKLYSIYSPPNHPAKTIDKTRIDAIIRERRMK